MGTPYLCCHFQAYTYSFLLDMRHESPLDTQIKIIAFFHLNNLHLPGPLSMVMSSQHLRSLNYTPFESFPLVHYTQLIPTLTDYKG